MSNNGIMNKNTLLLEEFELNKSNSHFVHYKNSTPIKNVEVNFDSKMSNGKSHEEKIENTNYKDTNEKQLEIGVNVFEKIKKYKKKKKTENGILDNYQNGTNNISIKQTDSVHFGNDIYDIRHISANN